MLSWIKNVFKKQEAEEVVHVSLDYLPEWLDDATDELKEEAESKILKLLEEARQSKEHLMKAIITFRDAELRNPNISAKELELMKGNKDNYLKNMSSFHDKIKIPVTKDKKELESFLIKSNNQIEMLNKSTYRSFQILQHFFANESKKIVSEIAVIDSKLKEVSKILTEGKLKEVEQLKFSISSLIKLDESIMQITEEIKKLEQEKQKLQDTIKKTSEQLEKIENNEEYRKLKEETKKLNDLIKEQEKIKAETIKLFSPIDKAIKKYNNSINDKLLSSYSDNPYDALIRDEDMIIISIMSGIIKELSNNGLGLREDKKDKAINASKEITYEKLSSLRTESLNIKTEMENIKRIISKNSADQAIKELNYKKEALTKKEASMDKDIEELKEKEEAKTEELSKLKEELASKITNITNVYVVID